MSIHGMGSGNVRATEPVVGDYAVADAAAPARGPEGAAAERRGLGVSAGMGALAMRARLEAAMADGAAPAGPAQQVAAVLASTFEGMSAADVQRLMQAQYTQLGLMTAEGAWKAPELEAIGEVLLPSDLDGAGVQAFVGEIARCAEANPYLVNVFERAEGKRFGHLEAAYASEGAAVMPTLGAYALVLDRLTKAQRDDWKVMRACKGIWDEALREPSARRNMSTFGAIKHASVEIAIEKFLAAHESGRVGEGFGTVLLPVNIVEACVADLLWGKVENARAGFTLAEHGPSVVGDRSTGAAPAHFSADGAAVRIGMPLPKEWADLYQTWNLALVSQLRGAPFYMTKLLIPQVAGYQDHPEEYMYNRVIALYTHLHYMFLGDVDGFVEDGDLDWGDDQLAKVWGQVNEESAKAYEAAVDAVRTPLWRRLATQADAIFG